MDPTAAPPGARSTMRPQPSAAARDPRRFAGVRLVDLERIRERIPAAQVGTARLVLLALAELNVAHYDPNRPEYVRASVEDVAAYAGITARTVYRVLPLLVAEKMIGYRPGRGTRPSLWRIRPIGTTSIYPASPDTAVAPSPDEKSQPGAPSPDMKSQPPVRGSISLEVSTSPLLPSEGRLAGAREASPIVETDGRTEGDCIEREGLPPDLVAVLDRLGGTPPVGDDLAAIIEAWAASPDAVTAIADDAKAKRDAPMGSFIVRIKGRWHEQERWQDAGRRRKQESRRASGSSSRFAEAVDRKRRDELGETIAAPSTSTTAAQGIVVPPEDAAAHRLAELVWHGGEITPAAIAGTPFAAVSLDDLERAAARQDDCGAGRLFPACVASIVALLGEPPDA